MKHQREYSVCNEDGEEIIFYGITEGSDTILYIKSGLGGNHHGKDDKYVRIAESIHEKYGCTVICASNLQGDVGMFSRDMEEIKRYALQKGFVDYRVYFMGVSNGGNQGILMASQYPEIRKMLMVNMPLMINFHKTTKGIKELSGVRKIFVYGTRDQSYKYIPFLEILKAQDTEIVMYEGADHNFKGYEEVFRSLPELLFNENGGENEI